MIAALLLIAASVGTAAGATGATGVPDVADVAGVPDVAAGAFGAGPQDLGAPRDARLDQAAASLAHLAAERGDLAPVSDPEALRLEVARAGAQTAQPLVWGVRVLRTEEGIARLRELALSQQGQLRPTAAGWGRAQAGDGSEVQVALLSRSPIALAEPLPSTVAPGTLVTLRGRLLQGLRHPQVHVTPPGGLPVRLPITREGDAFRCELHLFSGGRTVVEVVGVGAEGPEVALLADVHVGEAVPAWTPLVGGPQAAAGGEVAWVQGRIAALRGERGLPPHRHDPALTELAQRKAAELAQSGRLAHRAAGGSTVAERLAAQGVRRGGVGENLGEGPTVEAAQAAIERSPAHLGLLLDPSFIEVGVGVARRPDGGVVIVQILAHPAADPARGRVSGRTALRAMGPFSLAPPSASRGRPRPSGAGSRSPPRHLRTHLAARRAGSGSS